MAIVTQSVLRCYHVRMAIVTQSVLRCYHVRMAIVAQSVLRLLPGQNGNSDTEYLEMLPYRPPGLPGKGLL